MGPATRLKGRLYISSPMELAMEHRTQASSPMDSIPQERLIDASHLVFQY